MTPKERRIVRTAILMQAIACAVVWIFGSWWLALVTLFVSNYTWGAAKQAVAAATNMEHPEVAE